MQSPNTYQGKQILITSDRLVFNAREDSLFSSNSTIAFATNKDFHVNANSTSESKVVINSSKIYLGGLPSNSSSAPIFSFVVVPSESTNEVQNAVKGQDLEILLNDILDHLNKLYTLVLPVMSQISTIPTQPTTPNPANEALFKPLIKNLKKLKGNIKNIKSENVYLK